MLCAMNPHHTKTGQQGPMKHTSSHCAPQARRTYVQDTYGPQRLQSAPDLQRGQSLSDPGRARTCHGMP